MQPAATNPELLHARVSRLHQDYAAPLLRYASVLTPDRELAREAVQESFLRYFVACQTGRTVANDRAFLYTILRNYLLDEIRSSGHRSTIAMDALPDQPGAGRDDPEWTRQEQQILSKVRHSLSPREMEIVELRADGLTYEETAAILGITAGTVASSLARVARKLRRLFPHEMNALRNAS